MFSVTLVRTTSFSIYQKFKYKYSAAIGQVTGGDEPLITVNRPGSTPTIATMACFGAAGATTGALVTFLSCTIHLLTDSRDFRLILRVGPFELTKLSAQISTLMAKNNHSSMDDPAIRASYAQKGTFRTMQNIIALRGLTGMYSGFRFHLRESRNSLPNFDGCSNETSKGYNRYNYIFQYL